MVSNPEAFLDNIHAVEHLDKIQSLAEGHSHVVPLKQDDSRFRLITDGWRVKRLPTFGMNRVMFDSQAKELVLVTNGACILDHSSPESFQRSHNGCECQYAPSESIALRPIISDGKVSLAWTYRAVNPCYLENVSNEAEARARFESVLTRKRSARFIGRV